MKRRTAFIVVGMILSLIGTALGFVYWQFTSLPHPDQSSHDQLIRWVVLRDLNEYDEQIQLALVNRFAKDAEQIFGAVPSDYDLPKSYSDRMLANVELLKKVWFSDRIQTYLKIEEQPAKEAFLETQISLMDQLGNIAYENAKLLYPEKDTENLTTISDELLKDIDGWLANTPDAERPQTLQAVREATVFWLTTQNLEEQVMDARKELVSRVIAELEVGMDLHSTTSVVSGSRSEILRENALFLMEAWMHLLAEEYSELPKKQQGAFLDEKIGNVRKWKLLEFLNKEGGENITSKSSAATDALSKFGMTLKKWGDRADESMKPKIRKLTSAIQQRVFIMYMRGQF